MEYYKKYKYPIWFSVVYVAVILLFAYIYTELDYEFYHTTIQYEQDVSETHNYIISEFNKIIDDKFIDEYKHESAYLNDDWLLNVDDLYVYDMTIEEDRLTLEVSAHIINLATQTDSENRSSFVQVSERIKLKSIGYSYNQKLSEETLIFSIIDDDISNLSELGYKEVNPALFFSKNGGAVNLTITEELSMKLETYKRSIYGFPSELEGDFDRMLYLSMVTITTLGYGDIVPLTDRARFLVGLESVLGILILGWFATAMFNSVRDNRN